MYTGIPYLPTPEEVVRKCAEIRSKWSDEEAEKRRTPRERRVPWTVSTVSFWGMFEALSERERNEL